jgi:hypothetical protein
MKDMLADRDFADRNALLEFLKAYYALSLLELVYSFIIRALTDQSYELLNTLFLSLDVLPQFNSQVDLVSLDLLF